MSEVLSFPITKENGEINPWLVAGTVMLATFMEVLDTSVANVALPHIAGSLSASVDESTWVLTSYLVSNAIVLPLSGWFSSLFGRKRFYMFCVALFTVSSFLCGLAPSLPLLVTFRVLQGAGGGALQPVSQAILVESFSKKKQGQAMAIFGMGVVFAPVIGPTLGGWITDNYSWRWIFFINIPIGILSLLMTQVLVFDPSYLKRMNLRTLRIDYIGIGLLSVGLGFLQIMLDKGQRDDWFGSHFIVACAVITGVALIGAVFWELHSKDPVVDLHLLRDRNFALATLTMFTLGLVLYATTVLLPEMAQLLLGYDATTSGWMLSPGGVAVMVLLPFVGWLLSKIEPRWLVTFGASIIALSLVNMAHFSLDLDFRTAMLARVYQSCGMAFLFVPINVMAFYFISKERTNNATGIINLARNIGGSVGISWVQTLLARQQQIHQHDLVAHATPYSYAFRAELSGMTQMFAAHSSSMVDAASRAQGLLYESIQRQSMMLAFVDNFRLLAGVSLVIVPFMFLMKKIRPQKGGPTVVH
ncbi:MAG: DHA2 family efflux MFS transporter permease subunit [Candidatus Acidiferrales bacterium]